MAKILKSMCSICAGPIPERCDGREFRTRDPHTLISRVLCYGRDEISQKEGKYYYRYVRGHGEEWDVEVLEVGE